MWGCIKLEGGIRGCIWYHSCLYVPSVRTSRLYVSIKNCFRSISFEKIIVLNSYFIHRYIIIKYRPYSI